jgi:hypothetical protein
MATAPFLLAWFALMLLPEHKISHLKSAYCMLIYSQAASFGILLVVSDKTFSIS